MNKKFTHNALAYALPDNTLYSTAAIHNTVVLVVYVGLG